MPVTVPPFNWPVPEDTDPLADGAGAMRALAGAIGATVTAKAHDHYVWARRGAAFFNESGAWALTHGQGVTPVYVDANFVAGSTALRFTVGTVSASALNLVAWRDSTTRFVGSVSDLFVIAVFPRVGTAAVALPDVDWAKPDIVAWLVANGVTLDEEALSHLTKAELLALVADLTDTDE